MKSKDDCFYNSVYVVGLRLVFVSIVAENGREVAQKKGETFDTEKQMALSQRRCTEDAGKMFGADAISANVAKHICVFEGKC